MTTSARIADADWSRVEQMFADAVELPRDERRDFCERACAGDAALRDEVHSLLEAHDRQESVLDRSPLSSGEDLAAPETLVAETRIGVWKVGALLGRGGSGEVYLATRADGSFDQVVALKRLYRDAAADLARFQSERQILATLEHAGIARLLDGGIAPDGRLYAVVEYVDGQPLTDYCRAHRIGRAGRLALFLQVCDVVAFAHRNLVVHRDLKPGNILVTPDGRIKLLDFGVAKRLDRNVTEGEATSAPFTSDYAAPEQLTGRAITTATDVYALGVILFELLCGERPWRSEGLPIARVVQLIVHDEAPSLSRTAAAASEPPVPAGRLAGDLDAIVSTCLRKDAADRYPTIDALVRDIERYRGSEPVAARGRARFYVFGRLLKRYRWAVGASALLVVTLAVGLAATMWQARRAEVERDVAQRAATREEAVRYQLTNLFRKSIGPKSSEPITAKTMLDLSAKRVLTEYRTDPRLLGSVVVTLADLYGALEDVDGQVSLLEGYLAMAGPDADRESVALAEQKLAMLEMLRGNARRAAELLPKAEAVWAGTPDQYHEQRLEALFTRAMLMRSQGDLDGSIRTYQAAIDERIAFSGRVHRETASLYNSLAITLSAANRLDEALDAYRDTLDIFDKLGQADDLDALVILGNTGVLAYRAGHLREAESILKTSFEKQRARAGDSAAVAAAMGMYGATLTTLGRPKEAIDDLRVATDMATRFVGNSNPMVMQNRLFLADALILQSPGREDVAEARRLTAQTIEQARERFGTTGLLTLRARLTDARLDLVSGDSAASVRQFAAIAEGLRKAGKQAEPWVGNALVGEGDALLAQGRPAEAVIPLREAVALRERLLTAQSWELALARTRLGEALKRAGAPGGDALLEQGIRVLETELGTDHPQVARARRAMALPA